MSVIVKLSGQLQNDHNKTIYIEDNSFVGLCVKDADVNDISEISDTCTDSNEYNFSSCIGAIQDINGIICTDLGSIIKIENLRFSAVKGTLASNSTVNNNPIAVGGCTPIWSCTSWSNCDNNTQQRICSDTRCRRSDKVETQICIVPLEEKPVGSNCVENWSCTEWSACENNSSKRTCLDKFSCGTDINKPSTSKDCVSNKE